MTTVNTPATPALGIVFSIRTVRQLDLDTMRSAILRAGFVRSVHGMALIAHKADAALAVLDYASHLLPENLTDCINVELGRGIEHNMGSRLVADLEHLASDLDATICNADGEVLTLEALNALAAQINATAAQRIDNPTAQPVEPSKPLLAPPVRLADGTLRTHGPLSFTYIDRTARGRRLDSNCFAIEPMGYEEGKREGLRMAGELLAHIKVHKKAPVAVGRILAAAFGAELPNATYGKKTTGNVAVSFIQALTVMVESSAKHLDHASYIERAIARSHQDEKDMANWERARHQTIAIKAAATRAARRAAKGLAA